MALYYPEVPTYVVVDETSERNTSWHEGTLCYVRNNNTFYVLEAGSWISLTGTIPQLSADPSSPAAEDSWVLYTAPTGSGEAMGMLLTLTYPGSGPTSYNLKYRTNEGTTVSVLLT